MFKTHGWKREWFQYIYVQRHRPTFYWHFDQTFCYSKCFVVTMFMHVLLCMVLCSSVYSTQNTLIDVASRLGASICVKYLNATGLAIAFTYNGKHITFLLLFFDIFQKVFFFFFFFFFFFLLLYTLHRRS